MTVNKSLQYLGGFTSPLDYWTETINGMARKILYALIMGSLILVAKQVTAQNDVRSSGTTLITSPASAGSVEVRISASQTSADLTAVTMTVSGVEIYLASGWTRMTPGSSNKIDLKQAVETPQTIATISGLNPGTYTQIRLTISRVDVTAAAGKPLKATMSTNIISFTQNYQVSAKNTTVLVINFDMVKSIDSNSQDQVGFTPVAKLVYNRATGVR